MIDTPSVFTFLFKVHESGLNFMFQRTSHTSHYDKFPPFMIQGAASLESGRRDLLVLKDTVM